MIGLDIAGIDFICPDITEPVRETGGAICEVNAAPGFRMHTHPTIGEPQFIAKPVMDMLFPPGAVADPDRRGHQRQDDDRPDDLPHLQGHGPQGRYDLDRRRRHRRAARDRSGDMPARGARMVLQNPRVDFAVFEVARGGILREGLGYERNDVAVVLNVQPDHLGLRGIDTVEQLADVKAVMVEAVPATATPCSTPTTRWSARCAASARARSSGSRWRSRARRCAT